MTVALANLTRQYITTLSSQLTAALSIVDATVDEGSPIQATFARNWNGGTPVAWYARFAGQTTPVADPNATFAETVPQAIAASIAAWNLAHPGDPVTAEASDDRRVNFPAGFTEPFLLSRATNTPTSISGDESVGWKVTFVSVGTITTAEVLATLSHNPVVGAGALASVAYSQDWYDIDGGAGDICEVTGKDSSLVAVPIASISLGAGSDYSGRFSTRHTGSGATSRVWITASGAPLVDFEGANPRMLKSYSISFTALDGSGNPVTTTLNLRPRLPNFVTLITGGTEGTVQEYSTSDQFRTFAGQTTANRLIRPATGVTGVLRAGAAGSINLSNSQNCTFEGSADVVFECGDEMVIKQGDNYEIRNMAFAVGMRRVDLTTPKKLNEVRDFLAGVSGTARINRLRFKNCDFYTGNDENVDIRGNLAWPVRRVEMDACLIAHPFYDAGHDEGLSHNENILWWETGCVSMHHCAMHGAIARSPLLHEVISFHGYNNAVSMWELASNNGRFGACIAGKHGSDPAIPTSVLWEANLFSPPADVGGTLGKSYALKIDGVVGSISHVYLGATGYKNHFVLPRTDNFTDQELTTILGITFANGSTSADLASTAPFEHQATVATTLTEANRRALWALIINNVGTGSNWCKYIRAQMLAGRADFDISPYGFAGLFGPNWDGTVTANRTAVACVATSNITLSGEQTIDGVLTSSSRVLVVGQTPPGVGDGKAYSSANGVYVSSSGAWTRAADMDEASEFPGAVIPVTGGTVYAGSKWTCNSVTAPTIGTSGIGFFKALGYGVCTGTFA